MTHYTCGPRVVMICQSVRDLWLIKQTDKQTNKQTVKRTYLPKLTILASNSPWTIDSMQELVQEELCKDVIYCNSHGSLDTYPRLLSGIVVVEVCLCVCVPAWVRLGVNDHDRFLHFSKSITTFSTFHKSGTFDWLSALHPLFPKCFHISSKLRPIQMNTFGLIYSLPWSNICSNAYKYESFNQNILVRPNWWISWLVSL